MASIPLYVNTVTGQAVAPVTWEQILTGNGMLRVKTSGEVSLTQSNTTLENVAGLSIALAVGEYKVSGFLAVGHDGAAGGKFGLNFTGTHVSSGRLDGVTMNGLTNLTGLGYELTGALILSANGSIVGTPTWTLYQIDAMHMVVSVGGTLTIQSAQNTSSATAITARGYLIAEKLP
jgi:hypothetical protein